MLKTKVQSVKIRSILASSLTMLSVLSCLSLNLEAVGAPNSKTLTPEQFAKKSQDYLRYQQYVRAQVQKRYQAVQSQRLQQSQQQAKDSAATALTQPKTPYKPMPINRQEILLVMPAKGAKGEDIKQAIEAAQGEICGTLGGGALSVILVKAARPGKLIELQRALALDTKDFKHVDYNRPSFTNFIPTTEPSYSAAWHLMRMNITDAWDELAFYPNFPMPVAVFDTGTQGREPFLVDRGADCSGDKIKDTVAINLKGVLGGGLYSESIKDQEKDIIKIGTDIRNRTSGNADPNGHGTWVGCTITGSPYNSLGAAGVNPMVAAYPIKIYDAKGKSDDLAIVAAMCVMYTFDEADMRIINISSGPLVDARDHAVLHEFFKDWYNRRNGLIFISAGNKGENLKAVNQPYINVVSAMGHKAGMHLAKTKSWQSAFGTPIDFTAPGEGIQVCNPDGKPNVVDGTSFSSPIVAGVASMIWLINPKLKNTEVEQILQDSCQNTGGPNTWNPQFGWGMPDALAACAAAEKSVRK
jgi:NACalpha-BTF3-like transcription factor